MTANIPKLCQGCQALCPKLHKCAWCRFLLCVACYLGPAHESGACQGKRGGNRD